MRDYSINDVLRIAKRHNNKKRSYLLINPLQGKHLPTSPTAALEMMKALGDKVATAYPGTKLVIGFAETATAIGAMVAASISNDCIYIHTTREFISPCIDFLEEHSHAPEQRLYSGRLDEWIANTSTVVFVDDELSTGKTLRNIIRQLKSEYPDLNSKHLVAASIINRLTPENEALLQQDGVDCVYLVKISEGDFDLSDISTTAAEILPPIDKYLDVQFQQLNISLNPRLGVSIDDYKRELCSLSNEVFKLVYSADVRSILVIGTEECMLPAICIGRTLEPGGFKVLTHSTTRSPIAVSQMPDYPIKEGYQLYSFYDINRTTYIYNLQYYDLVLIVSDTNQWRYEAVNSLMNALKIHNCNKVIFIGGNDVQHI